MTPERQQLEQAVTQALEYAKKNGADSAEVYISKQTGISVSTLQSEVESIEFNHDGALGIAIYQDGRKGSASTSDLSRTAIETSVNAAIEIARHTSQDPCAGLADAELLATDIPDLDLCHPTDLNAEHGIKLASECERLALDMDSRLKASDGASYYSHNGIRVYGNTHGFLASYPSSRHSLNCMLIAEQDGQMQRDYSYTSSRIESQLWSPETLAKQAVERTIARLGSKKIPTQKVPVLFDPGCACSLLGHFVSAISGGSLYRRSSFLLDSLGEQIFPSWFNINEFPHIKQGLASTPYDSEGVATKDLQIIKNGELQSYLLTSYAGRKLGMQSTGHAGGIHNWVVKTGNDDLKALFKKMGTGLYVTELMGQGVNIITGDYSRGAAGFWIENGEIAFPVHEVTVAGNLKDIYQHIIDIGNDVDERLSMRCGSMLIEKMQVAGS